MYWQSLYPQKGFLTFAILALTAPMVFAQSIKIGVGSSVVTPSLDLPMAGYYYPRSADGVHDDLRARAIVFDDGSKEIVLVSCETIQVSKSIAEEVRKRIQAKFKIPGSQVLISAIHSHTGSQIRGDYATFLGQRIVDAVITARGRKAPAQLYVTKENEPSLPHYRRFFLKDGSVRTNPGFLNPDVVKPAGEIDPEVGVLYAEDSRKQPMLTWVNYAMHLDTVGGTWISADYPYFMGRLLRRAKGEDMMSIFTIAAAGNINHWDVFKPGPQRGFETAQRLGEVLGAAVIKAYTHLDQVSAAQVKGISANLTIPVRKNTPQEVEEARKILAQPPPENVDFTLDRVKAGRVMGIERLGGKDLVAELQVLSVGPVAFVGIPGELFVELGKDIKKRSPYPYTFIVELANDSIGYIPTRAAYEQGSYEPTSSRMAPGAGEAIVEKALQLLRELKGS